MPRNFYRRVEIAFPIDAPALREEMVSDILPSLLNDQVKARELEPDGSYVRLHPAEGAARSQAQLHFRERSRQARKAAAELQAQSGVKLIPIKAKRDQRNRA
jgi:polyphosphate kinase